MNLPKNVISIHSQPFELFCVMTNNKQNNHKINQICQG